MRAQRVFNIGQAFAEAMRAYEDGRSAEARRLARQLVEARPDFGGAHYLMGLLAIDQGHARRAIDHLARAIAITPGQPVLHVAMGKALELDGKTAEAVLHYRMVLGIDRDHAEAHARLAELLGRMGKLGEAVAHAHRAVAAHPGHAEAWNTLGALLHQDGRPAEAAEALRHALELRPDWPTALNNLGVALQDLGRLDHAQTMLAGAVELKPANAAYRANLASVLRLMGRLDEARAQAERATRTDSRNADAWIELGLARKAQGHAEGAAAAFERAVAAAPKNVHAHYCLAEMRRLAGDGERAAAGYRRCLDLDPEDRHGAALGLAQTGGAPPPGKAPEAYVRQLFDDYADSFDRSLLDKLDYKAPALIGTALDRVAGAPPPLEVLDVGCGTGLAGEVLRARAARLDGIDLSPAMVTKAAQRGIYDDLAVGELTQVLEDRPRRYDLVVAADVLVYVGELAPVMRAVRGALRPGGRFAFTVERSELADTYVLGPKNRYAHAPRYVAAAGEAEGFTVELMEDAVSRREAGQDVPGLVVVLRRD
ncbi:MAG: tetratricopeptide repeat protein [Pseudomonadota bacterium]